MAIKILAFQANLDQQLHKLFSLYLGSSPNCKRKTLKQWCLFIQGRTHKLFPDNGWLLQQRSLHYPQTHHFTLQTLLSPALQ